MVAQAYSLSITSNALPPYHLELNSALRSDGHEAARKHLLASLRGQVIRIPDLRPLFSHWTIRTNPEVAQLRVKVRDWLNNTIPPGQGLDALQTSDFGLFGATWWPQAPFDRLQIVTYLAIWLFTWDDEIDLSNGHLWSDFRAAQSYRNDTLAYVSFSLGLNGNPTTVKNRTILNFAPIGEALRAAYNPTQRKMVYDEIRFFMEMSEQEQRLRLAGTIPSLHDFWRYRLGSSAVTVCLALNEYSWGGMGLPGGFYQDQDVRDILRYTNTIISATNDLLSIKKEIKRDAIDSLVPIIFFQTGDIETAVNDVVRFISLEIRNMDTAIQSLLRRYEHADEHMRTQVGKFIDGCKNYVTGNLLWSLETDRYGVEHVEGQIVMVL